MPELKLLALDEKDIQLISAATQDALMRVGDIGCGYHAGTASLLLDDAKSMVLADVSLSSRLKDHPKVVAIEGRLPESLAAIPDASLDLVICNSVIEHLWGPLALLKEIHRIAVPGGLCLINAPSWRGKWFLEFSAYRLGLSPPEEIDDHKTYYDPRDLIPLLEEAGFQPDAINCFSHKFGLNTFAECRVASESEDGDQWDDHWKRYAHSAQANPAQAFRRNLVFRLLESAGAENESLILDIGCGSGDLLAALSERYPNASLAWIDASRAGLHETQSKLPTATLRECDLGNPEVDPGALGGWASHAVCSEVLEHVDDPARLLTNAAEFMKDGAALVLTVPGGPMSAFDRHIGHRRHFTAAMLEEILEDAGFEVVKAIAAGFPTFNLYRLAVVLRGGKLIADVGGEPGFLARTVMGLFSLLLPLSLFDSPWGWQIAALAMKKD